MPRDPGGIREYTSPINNLLNGIVISREGHRALSTEEITSIIVKSFEYSQGNFELQFMFLICANRYYGNQDTSLKGDTRKMFIRKEVLIPEPDEKDVVDLKLKRSISGTHSIVPSEVVFMEIRKETSNLNAFDAMFDALAKGRFNFELPFSVNGIQKDGKFSERSIVTSARRFVRILISEDFRFLVLNPAGRENRLDSNLGKDDISDRYNSYFVNMVIRQKDSGDEFYNFIFGEIKKCLVERKIDIITKFLLRRLVAVYNEHHNNKVVID